MRTTLTLDPDVVRLLEQEEHRLRKPFKQIVNDALRRALTGTASRQKPAPYSVTAHKARLRPGLDRLSLNRLADELEDEAVLGKGRR